jgi:hypothetical protein
VKKSVKIGLVSVAAIVAVVSSLALFTHARESAADSRLGNVKENESAMQAFSENFQQSGAANSAGKGESAASEAGEAPGR